MKFTKKNLKSLMNSNLMKNNMFNMSGGVLLLLASVTSTAAVMQGQIEKFRLFSCGEHICFTITSDIAYLGRLDGNYAFDDAKVMILDKITNQEKSFSSSDVYYDVRSNFLFIRNADEKNTDIVLNVNDQKISTFNR